ncbi:hypothetical protein ND748_30520, partial [Frankia sp. AiPs1]
MSDVPQAPYGEEGDARPVSLIGARIPTSASRSNRLPDRDDQFGRDESPAAEDAESPPYARSGRRRHRRRSESDSPQSPDEAWQSEAFHLDDATPATEPGADGATAAKATSPTEPPSDGHGDQTSPSAESAEDLRRTRGNRPRRAGRPA